MGGGKVTKGEVVRRWVLDVPIGVLPPSSSSSSSSPVNTGVERGGTGKVPQPSPEVHDPLQDPAEAIFALGGNADALPETKVEDKDSHLFTIADNLIKSQLARIDVPLLGVLNLDESDSEESSEEDEYEYEDDEYEEDYEGEEEEYDEEEYEDEEGCEEEEEESVIYECYGPGVTKMQVTTVPLLHQQQQQQQQHVKTEEHLVMSPSPEAGMGSEEVQLGTTGSGSGAGRKRGASEIS